MKKILAAVLVLSALGFAAIFWTFRGYTPQPDIVLINDAVVTAAQTYDNTEAVRALTEHLLSAFEEMDAARQSRDNALRTVLYVAVAIFALCGVLLYLYCDRKILKPFRRLQGFARLIAQGSFDTPLEMDKGNLFGAFTESFDLMREELHKSRENERKANQSKKELVAKLSHDVKTPVASIKAVTELMLIKSINERDEKERRMLATINAKAEQIDVLITNMFHAALEELHALTVTPTELQSTEIAELLRNADYSGRVFDFALPSCIVAADALRLQQVFDNIISNSYKYADTGILVNAMIDGERRLAIAIQDFGAGVTEDELPLLNGKFYRGKNAEKLSGYGLGLFISKYLMEQMSGDLHCESNPDGFAVRIFLKLAL